MSTTRPQLVIAIEGVLTSDPLDRFWDLLGAAAGASPAEVEGRFRSEIAERLFTGAIPEQSLWQWIAESYGQTDQRFWKGLFAERRYPLLAMHLLPRFAAQANVHLLSGLRSEWFLPLIEEEDLAYAVSKILFTDRLKISKDDPELWQRLRKAGGKRPALLVDVDQRAIELAREAGLAAIHADPELLWVEQVLAWLDQNSKPTGWKGLIMHSAPAFLRRLNNFGRSVPA